MSNKPMPPKDQRALLDSLEEQGCTVVPTRDGWRILFPDGVTTASMHKSQAEKRSRLNLRAQIKRAGLQWPFDHQHKKKGT